LTPAFERADDRDMPQARANGIQLEYDSFGATSGEPLLLVMGLGAQMLLWDEEFCQRLADRGHFVVRYDNRDVGLSSKFDDAPLGPGHAAYDISDMAADGIAVLDALGVDRAHVMGLSMGGMIVQVMAIEHPDRLLSMTSVMSRTGEDEYGRSTPEAFALLTAPPATDRESYVAAHIAGQHVWGSPAYADEGRWRASAERAFDRCFHPSGPTRQFFAIGASPPRADKLRHVTTPSLVIHGDRDNLIDISGGRRTAELIPGARFEVIEGMGHDYPPELWPRWVDLVSDFVNSYQETPS
jgi:pimeloyl-ACP methyl ester carboxylesterase